MYFLNDIKMKIINTYLLACNYDIEGRIIIRNVNQSIPSTKSFFTFYHHVCLFKSYRKTAELIPLTLSLWAKRT